MKIKITYLFLLLALTGCAEANFELSPESRLPKWFELTEELKREDVSVTLSYYVWPSGREAVLKIKKKSSFWPIQKVKGELVGSKPLKLKNTLDGYPSYEIITVNDITDIIEHRKMEPIFYTTDDPAIWEELISKK